MVTVCAMLLSIALGVAIALNPDSSLLLLMMPLWLFLRMAHNAIDEVLAREYHMQSKLGAVLNEMGDVISDSVLYLPLALVSDVNTLAVVVLVIVSVMVEMVGVVSIQIGASRRYDGPFVKSDRGFGFGLLNLLLGVGIEAASWSDWLLYIMLAFSVLTLFNRARNALMESDVGVSGSE
jgi:CDP-diacylglycerol--glycerol-3-phosphate 3-phosphatidyltransferase